MSRADSTLWQESMEEEMQSHLDCGTFELVPYDDEYQLIPLQWVYKIKQDKHGIPERAKSRLVARGDRCEQGVHYTETHAPVRDGVKRTH